MTEGEARLAETADHAEDDVKPYIPAETVIPEFTIKAIAIGAVFGVVFGAATVYLALKAGLTVSASIPIAVLSISLLRRLGGSTILENNIVEALGPKGYEALGALFFAGMAAVLYKVARMKVE